MKQYQPLYLKYRPQKLLEVIGQEVVTKTLTNAITYDKIVHAYLFCGPRGTGKTSTARILAKSLNCQSGITIDPCNKCISCESITKGNSLDVIEIDAASHRKVEDAENLINRVSLGTYGSRFKIYIIDEVHMLTDHAFNALLKTLEEPPKNVIFILATTEEYKVIPTIISRCQKLDFKSVSQEEIETRIQGIASCEKINIDNTITKFISKRANGCLRDAVSLLDQISVLQSDDKSINSEEVFQLFGTIDRRVLFKLANAILTFNIKEAVDLAENLVKSGKDIEESLKGIIELFIDLGKAKINTNFRESLSKELSDDLNALNSIDIAHIVKIIDRLKDSQSKLRFALSQELQFIVEVMSIVDRDFLISLTELKEKIERLEQGQQSAISNQQPITSSQSQAKDPKVSTLNSQFSILNSPAHEVSEARPAGQQSPIVNSQLSISNPDLNSLWTQIVSLIESNPTKTLLNQSESYVISLSKDLLELGIAKDTFLQRLEKDSKKKEMILQATKTVSGIEPANIRFRILARAKEPNEVEGNITQASLQQKDPPSLNLVTSNISQKNNDPSDNDFTKAIKDLLGAKKID